MKVIDQGARGNFLDEICAKYGTIATSLPDCVQGFLGTFPITAACNANQSTFARKHKANFTTDAFRCARDDRSLAL